MAEQDKQAAEEFADRASTQAKHAVKNTGRAARAATAHAVDEIGDAAEVVGEKAHDAAEVTADKVRRFRPDVLGELALDVGMSSLMLSISVVTGTFAVRGFRSAIEKTPRLFEARARR